MIYHNEEDLNNSMQYETAHIAHTKGFDTVQKEENGHLLCGKHGTGDLVDIYPDGSWVLKLESREGKKPPTGNAAYMLGVYFANPNLYTKMMVEQ